MLYQEVFKRKEWFGKKRTQHHIKEIFILNILEEVFGGHGLIFLVQNFLSTLSTQSTSFSFQKHV